MTAAALPSLAAHVTPFFLARQPILDRQQRIVAYELLFRSGKEQAAHVVDDRQATAAVISHAFAELGIDAVLGAQTAYINFDAEALLSDVAEVLPPERTVIELLETVRIEPVIVERCRALRAQGFRFALDDVVRLDADHTPLLPFVDVIKVDVLATPPERLAALAAELRGTGARLLAEKVDSREQADRCLELGFDLFQGYFFARPALLSGRAPDPSRQLLLTMLQQVLGETDYEEIQQSFKQAPDLSYKLMRLVNSVGMGLSHPIESLSHALVVLGRRQLQRWLQVLLFAHHGTGSGASPLLTLASTRGKLMELLAARGGRGSSFEDQAFMTGILSLLDTLLDTPMDELLARINVLEEVRAALLDRAGALGHLLEVVEALERDDPERVRALLDDDDLCTTGTLPRLQIEAMRWADEVAAPLD